MPSCKHFPLFSKLLDRVIIESKRFVMHMLMSNRYHFISLHDKTVLKSEESYTKSPIQSAFNGIPSES